MRKRAFTEKQREAVRANGRKSRGPVTAQGKANFSRNATRHGILANTIVLDDESRAGFFAELRGLQAFFKPSNIVESALVENMAISRWRQVRIWNLEKTGLTMEVHEQSGQSEEFAAQDPATRTARAFRTLCLQSGSFEALGRYEARFDRQYDRALARLSELGRTMCFLPNEPEKLLKTLARVPKPR